MRGARLTQGSRQRRPNMIMSAAAAAVLLTVFLGHYTGGISGQHIKYMTGNQWKGYLSSSGIAGWFYAWDRIIQPRIDALAALAEEEGNVDSPPYLVTMVGDSTMMQQHGVACAYLAERSGRRFDPAEHNDQCCVDTLPRSNDTESTHSPSVRGHAGPALGQKGEEGAVGKGGGGRGLCFRHAYQKFGLPPDKELLGDADAIYFNSGLHFLHMCRPGHPLEAERVRGWLRYEQDLEDSINGYRRDAGQTPRLVFMTTHTIEDSRYTGEFDQVLAAYRDDDAGLISYCESKVHYVAAGEKGTDEYDPDTYCRQALLSRRGSDVLNERSRPVMARLGVPLVEADLIVKDQAWATPAEDGRHYHALVPVEIYSLLGVLTSPYAVLPTAS